MYLKEFFKKYIKGTPEKAIVADRKMFLCYLTKAVMEGVDIFSKKKRSDIMSRVRSKETGIEIGLRKKLWNAG